MLELNDASWPAGPRPTVSGVNLRVGAGEGVALLGLAPVQASGLFRILQGEAALSAGSATFNRLPLRSLRKERGAVARIGGQGLPTSGRTAARALEAARRGAATAVSLAQVGLAGRGEIQVRHLSADARVRLALACALAGRAKLILFDAPTSGMDAAARASWLADLPAMLAGGSAAVLLIGAADEARALGGEVLVFDGGRVAQQGPAPDVFAHPCRLSVAVATSSPALNVLPMTMQGGAGRLEDGSRFNPPEGLALPGDGSCTLAFRPDDIQRERASPGCVRFVARETGLPPGQDGWVELAFGGARWLAPPGPEPRPGRVVNAFVPLDRVLVFDADGRAR